MHLLILSPVINNILVQYQYQFYLVIIQCVENGTTVSHDTALNPVQNNQGRHIFNFQVELTTPRPRCLVGHLCNRPV